MNVVRGTTGVLITIVVYDKTTGLPITGLTSASSGLKFAYRAQGHAGGATVVSLSAGTLGTWSSGGFVEIDATNMPGSYEIGLPNAALTTGAYCDFFTSGAGNMAAVATKVELSSGTVTVGGYSTGQDPATLVWNALTASFDTVNTFGAYLQSISGGGGGLTLDSVLAGHTTADTVGAVLNQLISLSIDGAGKVTYNNAAPPSPSTIAAAILANPAHLLTTDAAGDVTVSGYAAGQDPASQVLASPTHKLANDASGFVTYNNAAPPTAAAISAVVTPAATTAIVDAILANPAYPIVTNASGQVTYSNAAPPTLSAIETGVAGVILKTPSQPIATDAAGDVSLSSATITALLTGITTDAIAGGVLDQTNGIEVGLTVRQALRLIAAANLGTLIGAGTGTIAIDGAGIETTRITATVDVNGNRSVVTLAPGA